MKVLSWLLLVSFLVTLGFGLLFEVSTVAAGQRRGPLVVGAALSAANVYTSLQAPFLLCSFLVLCGCITAPPVGLCYVLQQFNSFCMDANILRQCRGNGNIYAKRPTQELATPRN